MPLYAEPSTVLWSREPAQMWKQALPLGNGRLGAMVFGSWPGERIQLNEESLWAGEPFDVYPPDFAKHLETVRQLVLAGKVRDAEEYGMAHLTARPTAFRSYEPLGDLRIDLEHPTQVEDYHRQLDLQTGITSIRYRADGVLYTREMLISAVDDLLAIRISTDKPGALNGSVYLTRPKDARVSAAADNALHLYGQVIDVPAPEGYDDNAGGSGPGGAHMRFAGRLLARATGGNLSAANGKLLIQGADDVTLLFTAATDFNVETMTFDRSISPDALAERILDKAARKSWSEIVQDHVAEHRSLFDRVSIDLGASAQDALPTDARLAALRKGADDPGLAALYFQFGRYLLMSSSRHPGRLPANLQGIWSDQMWAPLGGGLPSQHQPPDELLAGRPLQPFGDGRSAGGLVWAGCPEGENLSQEAVWSQWLGGFHHGGPVRTNDAGRLHDGFAVPQRRARSTGRSLDGHGPVGSLRLHAR
jgi:alpha-L-fucosidase 2